MRKKIDVNLFKRLQNDYEFRTFVASVFSFFVTVIFASYNVFLGISHLSGWNLGIGVYYFLLVAVKLPIIAFENKRQNATIDNAQKKIHLKKTLLGQSIMLFAIDFALIAPLVLMIYQKRAINFSKISAIATATYTAYKIITATIHFFKTRRNFSLNMKTIRKINFIDALVSVLSLQYILTITFGDASNSDISNLCKITSIAFWLLLLLLSTLSLAQAIKFHDTPN